MVAPLVEMVAEALGAAVETLSAVEPRRRRWKIARWIALLAIFSIVLGLPIAFWMLAS